MSAIPVSALHKLQFLQYVHAAGVVALIWEVIITFNAETKLVWPSKRSMIKALFIANRYLPIVAAAAELYVYSLESTVAEINSKISCISNIFALVTVFSSQGILIQRTYAIYYCDKRVLTFLLAYYTVFVISASIVTGFYTSALAGAASANDFMRYRSLHFGPLACTRFGLILSMEALTGIMTIYRYFTSYNMLSSRLATLLCRDGIIYSVIINVMSVINMLNMATGPNGYGDLLSLPDLVIRSVLTCRMVLRLFEYTWGEVRVSNHISDGRVSRSEIEFRAMDLSDVQWSP